MVSCFRRSQIDLPDDLPPCMITSMMFIVSLTVFSARTNQARSASNESTADGYSVRFDLDLQETSTTNSIIQVELLYTFPGLSTTLPEQHPISH